MDLNDLWKTNKLNTVQRSTKDQIDWKLIARHLPDMLQVAFSIQAGLDCTLDHPTQAGTTSRKNKLYYAFRGLGRVVRTLFLLEYEWNIEPL